MEVLTGQEMRRVDRRVIEDLGVPGLLLMESAGLGVARALLEDYPDARSRGVVVVCGKGHNGGDGLAAARHLARLGVSPRVILLAEGASLQGDAAVNLQAARGSGLNVEEISEQAAWQRIRGFLQRPVLLLDAILGTGIRGGARGLAAEVIRDINDSAADVVSVDIPSGLDADSPQVEGAAIGADRTYTLCRPKVPLVLEPASLHAGSWRVIPIGIPDHAVAEVRPRLEWLDAEAVRGLLPVRPPQSHKGTYGHLLAVAGSVGKTGAAVLLARGALRSGVGLVTVATARSAQPVVATAQAETMTHPLSDAPDGGLGPEAPGEILTLLRDRRALALGPGLGTEEGTCRAVLEVMERREAPAVLDADGLNAYAVSESLDRLAAGSWPLVLTPHPGEAARLLQCSTRDVQADRLAAARTLAERTGAVVVLKGHRSVVAHPNGRGSLNASGNPGMATGGMGDVLTGIIGALLARGMDAWDAARLAVFVHGDAGDRAALEVGQEGLLPSDLLDALPVSLETLKQAGELRPW